MSRLPRLMPTSSEGCVGMIDNPAQTQASQRRSEGSLRPDLAVSDIGMVMCGLASGIGRGFDWHRHLEIMLDGFRGRATS